MYLVIKVDGMIYKSKESDEETADNVAEQPYQLMHTINKDNRAALKVTLHDGGILVLGQEAVSRAHIIYYN